MDALIDEIMEDRHKVASYGYGDFKNMEPDKLEAIRAAFAALLETLEN